MTDPSAQTGTAETADTAQAGPAESSTAAPSPAPMPHDEFLWLEEIEGDDALTWVAEQNERTVAEFFDDDAQATSDAIRAALDSEDRIPGVSKLGDHYYNFWRDRAHPKGLWRRTTWESYTTDDPEWDVLLDVDALAAADGVEWVFHGARVRRTDRRRALVMLSPDGGDAHTVREFDLGTREFVDPADGFVLPTAKAQASWLDDDTLLIATDFGPGSLTDSTYPRSARVLRRGEDLDEAREIMSVPVDLLSIFTGVDRTPGYERAVIIEAIDFYNSRTWIRELPVTDDGIASGDDLTAGWTLIDVPTDVSVDIDRDLVLFRPRTDWEGAGSDGAPFRVPAGALAVAPYDAFVHSGGAAAAAPTVVFAPETGTQPRTSLQGWSFTRDHLVLSFLTDVRSELRILDRTALLHGVVSADASDSVAEAEVGTADTPAEPGAGTGDTPAEAAAGTPGTLPGRALPGLDPTLSVGMGAVDPDDDRTANDVWMTVSGYLTPTTLLRGTLGVAGAPDSAPEEVKQAPALFDATGLAVTQHFAQSADGTRVPYFQVGPVAAAGAAGEKTPDGAAPVMLDGYGGFEVSRLPGYAPSIGLGWLEKGGTYVVANIRGGGEYGPQWHTAALRENRHRAYEDFVAVARDLVARGVTVPDALACSGGSNGGLLVGNMLTQFPEDFGAVSCGVPLLDMRRYTKLSAGASWAAEYGDPDVSTDWDFIRTFSPYHLLDAPGERDYPPVLLWTATSDDRVGPVQARKMAAKMQAKGIPGVWFYEDREGGHSAAADNEQAARTRALSYAFLMRQLRA